MLFKAILLAATLSLAAGPVSSPDIPCGLEDPPSCAGRLRCVANSADCTDLSKCAGHCALRYPPCKNVPLCDSKNDCVVDPRPPPCGDACESPRICIPKKSPSCGGFAGRKCPRGYHCYDDPRDKCDPKKGGADCIGVCLR